MPVKYAPQVPASKHLNVTIAINDFFLVIYGHAILLLFTQSYDRQIVKDQG